MFRCQSALCKETMAEKMDLSPSAVQGGQSPVNGYTFGLIPSRRLSVQENLVLRLGLVVVSKTAESLG
jgi:hypothetical protein